MSDVFLLEQMKASIPSHMGNPWTRTKCGEMDNTVCTKVEAQMVIKWAGRVELQPMTKEMVMTPDQPGSIWNSLYNSLF